MADTTPDTKRLVRDDAEMWSEHDASPGPDLAPESFTGDFPEGEVQGRVDPGEFMREFTSAFPDFRVELLDLLASEGVVARGNSTTSHEGESEGTGRGVQLQAMAMFRSREGKIPEHNDYHDRHELL